MSNIYAIMLNNINSEFSIKDLENLSGIKAHTIRIWEKRYKILEPQRTDSNIRLYDLDNLKKLLNVTLLYESGMKISKIAGMDSSALVESVKEQIMKKADKQQFLSSLKLAMLNFDQSLFEQTYNRMLAEISFREVFIDIFVPFLHQVGIEWTSNSITPAHEHFVSNLIKQKLQINIERVQQKTPDKDAQMFVLYLPDHEIHDLGLLYILYELVLKGYHSAYLGSSVPLNSLKVLLDLKCPIHFVTYFTVFPRPEEVQSYLEEVNNTLLTSESNRLSVLGRNSRFVEPKSNWNSIELFSDLRDFINKM